MTGVVIAEMPRDVVNMNMFSQIADAHVVADRVRPTSDGSLRGRLSHGASFSVALPRTMHPDNCGLFPLPFPASQPSSAPGRRGKHIDSRPDFGGCSSLKMLMRPEVIVGAARVGQGSIQRPSVLDVVLQEQPFYGSDEAFDAAVLPGVVMGSGLAFVHCEVYPRRMARPLRIEFPHAIYHVTSRGNARQSIFADDEDRCAFRALLAHVIDRFGWVCHAYCLMDNHYHLLIETPQPNLSQGMRQLNGRYTQTYNRRHERVGHLFQGRFTAILVEKDAHLLELCRYVVLNPVRAQMVTHPRLWVWSSYRATVGEAPCPSWLMVEWVLAQFGTRLRDSRVRYRTFVAEGRSSPRPWDQLQGQIYLGSETFIEAHQPDRVLREIPRRQTQASRPSLLVVFRRAAGRDQAVADAYRRYGYRLGEIAGHLAVHYATVSRCLKRAEENNA